MTASNHIVVLGPGRCGTTAFVRLLHHLGYDIGDMNSYKRNLEWPIYKSPVPYVIKSPALSTQLIDHVKEFDWKIDHAYILLRRFDPLMASHVDYKKLKSPSKLVERMELLCRRTLDAILNCIELQISYTILEFPRWMVDREYCRTSLHRGHSIKSFDVAFDKTVDASLLRKDEISRLT